MDVVGNVLSNLVHDFAHLFAEIMGRPRRKNHSRRRFCCSAVVLYQMESTQQAKSRKNSVLQCTFTKSPRAKDHRGVNLISDALPFGGLWYAGPEAASNAIGYAIHRSRSHRAVIRVYHEAGNLIETHQHKGEFKEP
jgi:hypothetical protein